VVDECADIDRVKSAPYFNESRNKEFLIIEGMINISNEGRKAFNGTQFFS